MTAWLLKLHRWLAILFALPLAVLIGTGLLLSFEPSLVVGSVTPASLDAARIEAILARHDPAGKARGLSHRSYDGTLTIGGGRGNPGQTVDVATGEVRPDRSRTAASLATARWLHEHLLLDGSWLVITSTIALLVLVLLGLFMGWPRFANSLSGWHRGAAWIALPLVVLSPLTGLALAFGITLTGNVPGNEPGSRGRDGPVGLVDAVRKLGQTHDLSGLLWLRERRGQMLARIVEDGEYRIYAVGRDGVRAMSRNWPRLIHEGNWKGHVSAAVNVVTSMALLILLVTGLWIWARRQGRRRRNMAARRAAAASSPG